ncbi:MAG: hypothetical protein RIR66_3 [Actinomycetota bacterium]
MVNVVVLDYGSGNIRSAERALETTGANVTVTADFDTALNADGLLVPGVGAFSACMSGIKNVRGDQIIERRLAGGRPVLGICVGMQLLFDGSTEHSTGEPHPGIAQWPGLIEKIDAPVLPHMGWNTVEVPSESKMFSGISDERFYFVHTYAALNWELKPIEQLKAPIVTWANYYQNFVAAVENGPLWATQFHPEKSGDAGLQLLANWVATIK